MRRLGCRWTRSAPGLSCYKIVIMNEACGLATCKTFTKKKNWICSSKTCTYFSVLMVYAPMHPHTIREAQAGWSLLFSKMQPLWFPNRISNFDSFDHKTVFHFTSARFKCTLAQKSQQCFRMVFTYGFLFA